MKKTLLFVILLGAILVPGVLFADPVGIQGVGASSQKLANGNTLVHFTVRVAVFTTPLVFNYHWERSDGAKSEMKLWTVKPGVTSIPVSTTWEMGPGPPRPSLGKTLRQHGEHAPGVTSHKDRASQLDHPAEGAPM